MRRKLPDTPEKRVELLLAKIDELKSVYSGRDYSYIEHVYQGYRYSPSMSETFNEALISKINLRYQGWHEDFSAEMHDFYHAFFEFVLLFCEIQCNRADYVYESFLKLSKTIKKPSSGKSAADILTEDISIIDDPERKDVIAKYLSVYESMMQLYPSCYDEYFESNVRYAINCFLDDRELSIYLNKEEFEYAAHILDNAIRRTKILRHRAGE